MIIKNIWNHHLEYSFFNVPKNQGATGRWFPTLSECRLETQRTFLLRCKALSARFSAYGQLGVPLTYVYPWYLLCSLGILGDYNPQIPLYRAYITGFPMTGYVGIGVRPCLSPEKSGWIPWYNDSKKLMAHRRPGIPGDTGETCHLLLGEKSVFRIPWFRTGTIISRDSGLVQLFQIYIGIHFQKLTCLWVRSTPNKRE